MKFLKCLLILAFFALVNAENKNETLNLFGSIGWGFGTGGSLFSSVDKDYTTPALTDVKRSDAYLNYGRGFKFDLGAQYFMMKNVALQLGIGFSAGVPGLETSDQNFKVTSNDIFTDSTTKYKFGLFGIKVLVVPKFEILDLLNMYAGVGTGLFWSSMSYEVTRSSLNGTQTVTKKENGKIKASPTLALLGELGADYPLSDIISLYGEIALEQMSFTWKEKVIEKTEINQPGTQIYEKDVPNQGAPLNSPGSNWQIRFGLRFMVF